MTTSTADQLITDQDREILDRELADFVPDRVFDAHVHFKHPKFFWHDLPGVDGPLGWDEFTQLQGSLYPGRELGGIVLAYTQPGGDVSFCNQFVSEQVAGRPGVVGFMFVKPDDDPDFVRAEVQRLGLRGFKVYHLQAPVKPTWDADIPQYLPEWLVRIADDLGLAITLHMVKQRAVADPSNIHWIRYYCETYPNMNLILAHSARGFQPVHNLEGLPQIADLENVYFDCAVNCEPMAQQAVIRTMGHKRLMWGSDFPVNFDRGRSLGAADAFLWIFEDSKVWEQGGQPFEPALVGIEGLRALKYACWSERLTDGQIEDIFWNNAAGLFGLD